jgi:hypothetical protein
MTNVSEWVEEVRETLGGGIVEQVNLLASDFTPGDTTLTLRNDLKGITAGVPLCVGLNTFQVWSANAATKQVDVSGGWAGAPEVLALAGDLVRVKPNFYNHRILSAINSTLNELSSPLMGVFGVDIQDIDFDPAIIAYDLSSCEGIEKVLRVQYGDPNDDTDEWADLAGDEWQYRRMEATADFPSGHQLRIFTNRFDDGDSLRVIFSRRLSLFDSLDDDVTMCLLPETAYDLPVLGAASRLAIPQENRRNLLNAQPDSRRSDEVPPGASLGGARALRALYMNRVEQEASRLMAQYPPKRL